MARRPWRLSAKLLIISSVVTVIGFSAICVNVMLDMRRGEEALARQTLENLATTIESDVTRNIEIYDLSLKAVAGNMLLPEIATVSKPIRHLILFDHATTARNFGAIQVFDAEGRLTIDASTLDPLPENRSEEDYFRIHRDNPGAGLYISRPMLFRGAYAIVLSRRISDTDGGFLGVVAGSIRFSYFHELFERLNLNPDDTITVLKRDRTIMMRRPFDLDVIGTNLNDRRTWSADNLRAGASYAGQGPVDPTPRLYVRSTDSGPLFVVAGKPLNAVFELWQKEAYRIGAVVLALILFMLASTLVLAREIGRRAESRAQARGDGDDGCAHRPEEPPQVRPGHRRRMAPRHAPEDAGRAADDRCRSFQGLQRHVRPSGRRPGAGRHRHLHFRLGEPRRRLRRALWRRGIRRAAAGHLGHRRLGGRRGDPHQGAGLVRRPDGLDGILRHRELRSHHRHGLADPGRRRRQGALCRESRRPQPVGGRELTEAGAGGVRATLLTAVIAGSSCDEAFRIASLRSP
ncbi:hypothetical protein ACVWWK_000642 [Bradyrhizobium sp. LB9.1b]